MLYMYRNLYAIMLQLAKFAPVLWLLQTSL